MAAAQGSFEKRLQWLGLAASVPALLLSGLLLFFVPWPFWLRLSLFPIVAAATVMIVTYLRRGAIFPLQTVTNLLGALREGDFSVRLRGDRDGVLGELMLEANTLAGLLHQQRLAAQEANGLRDAVMAEIEVAILVFDPRERLILANRAAERLLGRSAEQWLGASAEELDLADCLGGDRSRTLTRDFQGATGRFALRRTLVRAGGEPHSLLAIANLSSALREEERIAWQRLIRVLGHELNNSLTPIKSIAGSLARQLGRLGEGEEARAELAYGLGLIEERAGSLARFLEGYSRIARLPPPRRQEVDVARLVASLAAFETRVPVKVLGGPAVELEADPDQLQQLLQNLLANAAEASLEKPGAAPIEIAWRQEGTEMVLEIRDDGPGIANPANLFVPYFTTKNGGSGIGLVLCRQIAEAHEGSIRLVASEPGGCVAELRLPLKNG